MLGEYSATGFAEYLWLDDLLVGVSTLNGLHRIETDHLGTPRIATGEYGNTTWRWGIEDNAFGQKPAETIGDGDSPGLELNLRFPGQYFDQETGLHYNYFRDYDPGVGRYVESDPIGLNGGINLFAYASSTPISLIDIDGLQVRPPPPPPPRTPGFRRDLHESLENLNDPRLDYRNRSQPGIHCGLIFCRVDLPRFPDPNHRECFIVCEERNPNQCFSEPPKGTPVFNQPNCYKRCVKGPSMGPFRN